MRLNRLLSCSYVVLRVYIYISLWLVMCIAGHHGFIFIYHCGWLCVSLVVTVLYLYIIVVGYVYRWPSRFYSFKFIIHSRLYSWLPNSSNRAVYSERTFFLLHANWVWDKEITQYCIQIKTLPGLTRHILISDELCPRQKLDPMPYFVFFSVFNGLKRKVVVCFVDMGGIVDHRAM
jgi:hypothetical protein